MPIYGIYQYKRKDSYRKNYFIKDEKPMCSSTKLSSFC
ncbi:hypothetical protein MXB_5559 [Myxobolus squamalis]|nr:hypothetical protein MXB_5559 [Myxobolus squamalis]